MTLRAVGLALRRLFRASRDAGASISLRVLNRCGRRLIALRPVRPRREVPPDMPPHYLALIHDLERASARSTAAVRQHLESRAREDDHRGRSISRALVVGDKTAFLEVMAALSATPAYRLPADRAIDEILMIEVPAGGRFGDTDAAVVIHAIADRHRPGWSGGSRATSRRG
ncbi:MAG: hypothetical protein GY791_07030 [Alphaproteobacteria bacterium]|nr:hypothetical protein [Alphaproteobacteria bacterium]